MSEWPFPKNQRIVFTGRLAALSRRAAIERVVQRGGVVRNRVNSRTHTLVIGADGWPMRSSGRLTRNLELADDLERQGHSISVIAESEFLRRLEGEQTAEGIRRTHSLEQISRLVGVSGLRLRRWVDHGLIRPVDPAAPLARFSYSQVIAAKTLADLIERGTRASTLLHSLQRLRRWLPKDAGVAEHMVYLERRLCVRDASGQLIEPGGQLRFDFQEDEAMAMRSRSGGPPSDPDELFEWALGHERQGEFSAAADAYTRLLTQLGDDPDVLFNLANTLHAQGRRAAASETYRRCINVDPTRSDAWNNLGLCLAHDKLREEAVHAMRRAVDEDPSNIDACYNLADLLEESGGESAESRLLWLRIARSDGDPEIVAYARQQLQARATKALQNNKLLDATSAEGR